MIILLLLPTIIKSHMVRYLIYHIFSYIFIFFRMEMSFGRIIHQFEKKKKKREYWNKKNRQKKRLISDSLSFSLFQSILPSNRSFHWLVKEKEWEITIHFKMRFFPLSLSTKSSLSKTTSSLSSSSINHLISLVRGNCGMNGKRDGRFDNLIYLYLIVRWLWKNGRLSSSHNSSSSHSSSSCVIWEIESNNDDQTSFMVRERNEK